MVGVRSPTVAGQFYPASRNELARTVRDCLAAAQELMPAGRLKAVIVPHAGYEYSGPIAGTAYAQVARLRGRIERVVLIGPAHRSDFSGLATTTADAFATPLGNVPIDREAVDALGRLPHVCQLERPHAGEHSLEVQLPFLQVALGDFRLVPLLVGEATTQQVAEALELLWGGDETLLVVSSDLSHGLDHDTALRQDRATSRLLEQLDYEALSADLACGYQAIRGLLYCAGQRGLHLTTLDLRNSGDTAGSRDYVVGYGAYAVA